MRVGIGYDVHRLVENRKMILGGVEIPCEKGLLGHSDADVLCHAIADALLGAIGEGDIGHHFPDHDPKYKGISSLILLAQVAGYVKQKGYYINNIDSIVIAQMPKIAPYRQKMAENIARTLDIEVTCVNVKGTTTEGLGFTGMKEGIAAQAIASVETKNSNIN